MLQGVARLVFTINNNVTNCRDVVCGKVFDDRAGWTFPAFTTCIYLLNFD